MTKFISEECYNDIMEMAAQMVAEAIINELDINTEKAALKERERRAYNALDTANLLAALKSKDAKKAEKIYHDNVQKFAKDKEHVKKHEEQLKK